jgi:hypothetical protein
MPPYVVSCYTRGCGKPAVYKIAARWSDGITQELKTYALTCPECLAPSLRASLAKQAACRTAAGESLEPPGVYNLHPGTRDAQLIRNLDLERQLASDTASHSG